MEQAQAVLQSATSAYKLARQAVTAEIVASKLCAETMIVELGKRLEVSIAQLKASYKATVESLNESTESKVSELEGLLEEF